ncbi:MULTISPECIES: P-II family nitrogen regulator [Stenotrophomonas]|jgi:nitrogen regulatory protein PII|uniref:P-II family nitrogen regulator n=1 Tax=Stenotrophomonas aracearum TaxID=3003272 RepID=A0ABY9YI16_9GAMM|nr:MULTISPECIES: P-II family nitrogen regulator [unclassified Stenotrophomonas]MBW8373134.1 P-II family nitrogen regulator [Stenotrophomonas sp.]WNH50481.1 P-II family nitrogen regulator [Stenotrophomonas sp. A5588]
MKQIKAFVHRNRVADLVHELEAAGFRRLSLFDVKGLLRALSAREQQYSVEFGDQVISEMQMELFCEGDEVARVVEIFRRVGRTGHAEAGAVYVSPIEQAFIIDGET